MAAGDTIITIVGNLTADPDLRFTSKGDAVCGFTVASTPRYMDKATNEWKDGEGLFLRVNAWKKLAENCAESLSRGTRVVVQGRLKQRSYETKEGEKRTVYEIEADEVAPSLKWATAKVNRADRQSNHGGAPASDPWASAAPAGAGARAGGGNDGWAATTDEPPF